MSMDLYFSDIFEVSPKVLDKHGADDILFVIDLHRYIDFKIKPSTGGRHAGSS